MCFGVCTGWSAHPSQVFLNRVQSASLMCFRPFTRYHLHLLTSHLYLSQLHYIIITVYKKSSMSHKWIIGAWKCEGNCYINALSELPCRCNEWHFGGVSVGFELDYVGTSEFLIWGTCLASWEWDPRFTSTFTSSSEVLRMCLHMCYFLHHPQKLSTTLYLSSQNFPVFSSPGPDNHQFPLPIPISRNVVEFCTFLSTSMNIWMRNEEKKKSVSKLTVGFWFFDLACRISAMFSELSYLDASPLQSPNASISQENKTVGYTPSLTRLWLVPMS